MNENLAEANHMRSVNPELHSHIWLGNYLDVGNLIMCRNIVKGNYIATNSDKIVVGVDIARDGGDRSVICVRKGKGILAIQSYPTMELTKLVHELQSVIYKYKPERINIDATGHGAWAPDALKASGIDVRAICFSESARHPSKYNNMRTELYGLASEYFEHGGVIRPQDIDLERELSASYYTLDNNNRMKLIPKTEIKSKVGKSPDLSDAFVLSLLVDGDMFRSTK